MTTLSQQRIVITVGVPVPLSTLLANEAKATDQSLARLGRNAIKWHRGCGLPRHPDRPAVSLANTGLEGKVQMSILIDVEDADYLDDVRNRIGLARTSILLLILVQYFQLETLRAA